MQAGRQAWAEESLSKLRELARPIQECSKDQLWAGQLWMELESLDHLMEQVAMLDTKLNELGSSDARVIRLQTMPGYAQFQKISQEGRDAVRSGALTVTWKDGKTFEYTRDGKRYSYDVATKATTELGDAPAEGGRGRGGRGGGGGPVRGRQFDSAESPDKKFRAVYNSKDRNLYVIDAATNAETAVTNDGSVTGRIKNGTASWVYGEELGQRTAMWWSPDSTKLAYYRFDESKVQDYLLQMKQTQLYSETDVEAYPKAGFDNPSVEVFIYDVATKKNTRVDVRAGNASGRYHRDVHRQLRGADVLARHPELVADAVPVAAHAAAPDPHEAVMAFDI